MMRARGAAGRVPRVRHMIPHSAEPPSQSERRIAAVTVAVSIVLFVALAPFATVRLGRNELFLPIYESALVMCDFITCVFLIARFGLSGSPALPILAGAYLFSAAMALLHELTFPGLFARTGLLWANAQTTAWLYFLWHLIVAAAVIAFTLAAERPAQRASGRGDMAVAVLGAFALAAVALLISTAGAHWLPRLMNGDQDRPAKYALAWFTWLVTLAALPFLWRHTRHSVLHLWLLVVIFAWSCDIAQAAVFNAGRFSLGWYTGRAYGLAASSFLLAVLILESGRLHRRIAEAHAAEHAQRHLAERRSAQLNRLTGSLETRIAERTAQLERANEALRHTRDELRQAAALGAAARESERARLARELHDELGQGLIMLKFQLDDLEAFCLERHKPLADKAQAMRQLIERTIEATKRMATDLRPTVLDVLGLAAAAEWVIQALKRHRPIDVRLRVEPAELEVGEPYGTVVFRILQEALTNIGRHADAGHVEVELILEAERLRLRVSDDGRGFDSSVPRRADAFGLLGMRERALMVSGALEINSTPGRGTTVTLSVPLGARDGAPQHWSGL
jgi:two-component system sensor histidine kinase UhpB